MNKAVTGLILVLLLVSAGCLDTGTPQSDTAQTEEKIESGLQLVNFTALNPELSPGDSTQVLLRMENGNEQPVRNLHGVLSNTNPLQVDDEVVTTLPNRQESSTTCEVDELAGTAEAAVGEQVDCLWTVTVPDNANPPLSVPVTATVTHGATVQTPAATIQFKDESETISTTREKVSVENGEVKVSMSTRSELPATADIVEITVDISDQGAGDFIRDRNGFSEIALRYDGSLMDLHTPDDRYTGGETHARPCKPTAVLEGDSTTFTCSFQLTEEEKQNGIIHDLTLEVVYSYQQTTDTRITIPD